MGGHGSSRTSSVAGQADALLIADGSCEPVERPLFDLVRIAYNDPNVDWQKFDLDRDVKFLDEKMVPSRSGRRGDLKDASSGSGKAPTPNR